MLVLLQLRISTPLAEEVLDGGVRCDTHCGLTAR
jgi:hypothetical protein